MYVFNLAAADLCMCLGNFPLLIVSSFEGRWTSGFLGCKIYSFLGGLAGFVSINTLTAMACDRYNVIYRYKGLLKPGSRRHSLGLLVSIWIYSAMWAAPPFLGWGGFSLDGGQISCCFDYLDRSASNVSYIIAIFVFCFGIQVVVIMFCYVSVVQAVYQHEQILKKGNMNVRLYQNHFHQHSANFTANNHNNHHLAGTSAAIPATTGTAAATATATTTAAVAAEKQAAGGGGSIAATTATTALATTSTAVVPTTTTTATTAAHQAITAEDGRRESLAAAAAAVAAEDLCVALPPRCATRKPPRKWRKRRVEAQVTKLVFFITASFCVSWMPFAVVSLIGVFGDASSITPLLSVLPGIMAKIGTVVNPLLYAIGHPHYRNVVRKHYRRARKRGKGGGGGGGGGGFGGGGRKVRARDGGRGGGGGGGGMHRGMPTTTRGMLSSVYFATILRRTDSISDHSPNVGTALQQHRGSARDV